MKVRKGQGPDKLGRDEFGRRFRESFDDDAFDGEREALARVEEIAWGAYCEGRKSPRQRPAGGEFADPSQRLSVAWLETRRRLRLAASAHADPASPPRVLLVCASDRNDKTCPGEAAKSFRLAVMAREAIGACGGFEVDLLDLSHVSSEYGRHIHPCKGCVSTAMPLCHWPCSCYPNHSLGQVNDWMNEIYERWVRAHGVLIVTPVYWYQAPSVLKLMIDRLVCADGGNPDPTTTGGKDPEKAKAIERKGWHYPKHLGGRAYGVFVHGDAEGAGGVRNALCDWLDAMELVPAGPSAKVGRYVGYYEPYAAGHDALDRDHALHEELKNAARAVASAVLALRAGRPLRADGRLSSPRPK